MIEELKFYKTSKYLIERHCMRPQNRINNPEHIDRLLIDKDLKDGKLVIVQFSDELYTDKILAELNEICSNYDENFSVRFYGHYQGSFNCKTLLKLPNIKALWLDCLSKADNLEVLAELQNIRRLSLGVFELKETEIFQATSLKNLEKLIICDTRTKALNLQYLENYKHLNYLIISGHIKNIGVVGELPKIEYLGLNSISKEKLDFVNKLRKLKSLHFALGGRENLDEIEENEIETLGIVRVRSFNNFKNISHFKKLKTLSIEDQIHLKELQFDREISTLTDFKLINCKTFESLTGLEKLSNLKQLRIYKTDIKFEEFIKQHLPKSLDILSFYTAKAKIDKEIKEKLLKLGYKDGLDR
jgi:protein phosphatase 1 regulatory subunit 7